MVPMKRNKIGKKKRGKSEEEWDKMLEKLEKCLLHIRNVGGGGSVEAESKAQRQSPR